MKEIFYSKFMELSAQPAGAFLLAGILIIIFVFFYLKQIKLTTKILTNMGLMIALTVILNMLRIYHMPQGGSVTLGGMVPLLLLSYSYGPAVGALAGFVYGLVNLVQDPFILHPVQVLFDYPLPYMAVSIAGCFQRNILMGAVVGIFGRFICHFISGAVFFGSYAPEGISPYWYSLVFNASYLIPDLLICLIILHMLPIKVLVRQMRGRS
ncbi:energy-coupled thiamine transporter ThiT [Pectinatus haikarae]|uniref:Thiamine transporter n=1 Tax=Pectinatus haikarae TaxID=349096 RepID=A0ABT9Y5M9_9FIRM|nr:energy-coupled thiamine transporter ThiT [Pectinatus haikarae]MDQ0202439.1 thiamine transporter [Pectinatus haikarae]